MADRPTRTLADVLDVALAAAVPVPDDAPYVEGDPGDLVADLRSLLDDTARGATTVGGWTADDPLRLTKATVTWLLRCPRRAVAASSGDVTDDLVAGLVVDAAAKLATLVPQRPPTVDAALEYLAATGDTTVADHLADHVAEGGTTPGLVEDLAERVARLAAVWPAVDPAWWPRVEEPVRTRLADGAVLVGGRLDLLLGGEPTDRPGVVVEVKGGRWYDGMRADGHLYALLVALRDGRPPAAVVTVVADGTTQVEPVRPAVLATAAERVERAILVAAPLAAGEPAATHPGPHCAHCPARSDCAVGLAWRPEVLVAG